MPPNVRTVVVCVVTAVWAINVTAPVFVRGYEPSPELNVAFMAIIAALFGFRKPGGDDED